MEAKSTQGPGCGASCFSLHARHGMATPPFSAAPSHCDQCPLPVSQHLPARSVVFDYKASVSTLVGFLELCKESGEQRDEGVDGCYVQVLAFPCNQFGSQEPGTCAEVKKFASTMYDADFPIFDKVRS